ncbi:hypothetical protein J6590_039537 [Homalodisca vitripennis]|nr:hypothetical protein J6590_039537 [Homalodisca vitripennis]
MTTKKIAVSAPNAPRIVLQEMTEAFVNHLFSTAKLPEELNPETKRLTSPPVTGRQLKSREGAAGVLRCSRSTAEDYGRERFCRISSTALIQYLLKSSASGCT